MTSSPPSRSSPPVRASTWSTTASGTKREKASWVRTRSNASSRYSATSTPIADSEQREQRVDEGDDAAVVERELRQRSAKSDADAERERRRAPAAQPQARKRRDQGEEDDQHEVPAEPEAREREVRAAPSRRRSPGSRRPTTTRHRAPSSRGCPGADVADGPRTTSLPERRRRNLAVEDTASTSSANRVVRARRSRSRRTRRPTAAGSCARDAISAATMPKLLSLSNSYGTCRITPSGSAGSTALAARAWSCFRTASPPRTFDLAVFGSTIVVASTTLPARATESASAKSSFGFVGAVNWMSTAIAAGCPFAIRSMTCA